MHRQRRIRLILRVGFVPQVNCCKYDRKTCTCNISEWPEQPYIGPTSRKQQEAKTASVSLVAMIGKNSSPEKPFEKSELWKVLRIYAQLNSFINKCRRTKVRGFLTTNKTENYKKF